VKRVLLPKKYRPPAIRSYHTRNTIPPDKIAPYRACRLTATITRAACGKRDWTINAIWVLSKTPENRLKNLDALRANTVEIFCPNVVGHVFSLASHIYIQFLFFKL
jgi:hypothetical protein